MKKNIYPVFSLMVKYKCSSKQVRTDYIYSIKRKPTFSTILLQQGEKKCLVYSMNGIIHEYKKHVQTRDAKYGKLHFVIR